jgi:DNA-binding YbaB/EbfC family protein
VTGEPPNLRYLAGQVKEMGERLALVKAELAETEVTGIADGGLVTVAMRGGCEVTRVAFDQAALDQGDAESLAALTRTAIRDATEAVRSLTADKMAAVSANVQAALGTGTACRPYSQDRPGLTRPVS